jgi:hypothetical protein
MYPTPATWKAPQGEHTDVTMLRLEHAAKQRAWLMQYVNDTTIPDEDLLAAFSQITYDDARQLARLALEVQCHCIPEHKFVCNKCRKEAS